MFVTSEHGIQMHDIHPKPSKADSLLFVSMPHLYFLRNIEAEEEDDPQVIWMNYLNENIYRSIIDHLMF